MKYWTGSSSKPIIILGKAVTKLLEDSGFNA
jgi:hypothetical protein